MLKVYLMASHGYLPCLAFHPPQDCQHLLPNPELGKDVIRSGPLCLKPNQDEDPWKPRSGLFDHNHFVNFDPTIARPVLIDPQDNRQKSTLLSFDFTKQAPRHEEIVNFLMSGLSSVERDGLYRFPDMADSGSRFIFPGVDFEARKPVMEFMGDLIRHSDVTRHEDVLSILAEFYLSRNSTNLRKHSVLVPQFNRLDWSETSYFGSSLGLETATFAPPKSPEKVKRKPSPRKKTTRNKTTKDKDPHRTNSIRACESLLSILFDKNRNGKSTITVLKKSGPELPNLLTQFSAGVAGTGLAVIFSVVCKAASGGGGRVVPLNLKLLDTGLGLGLVWVSWAVNGLRDTIVNVSKKSNKRGVKVKEEETMKKLDKSVKEIYLRAATLMAVIVVRLV